MVIVLILYVCVALTVIYGIMHGLAPAMDRLTTPAMLFAAIMFCIALVIRIKQLEKQLTELQSKLADQV